MTARVLARLARSVRRHRRDRGATTLTLITMGVAILMAIALVSDGADKVRAGRDATSIAQEAARAAGQQLATQAITGHGTNLDTGRAAAAARAYLATVGIPGTVSVSGDTVTVTTSIAWTPRFLAGIAPGDTLHGTATARAAR
jgi:hypothetical protein